MGHLREATADYGTRVIQGEGGLNSRLSLSAELAIELFCLAHIVCHGGAGKKAWWGEIQCQQVKYEAVSEILWKVSVCDRS